MSHLGLSFPMFFLVLLCVLVCFVLLLPPCQPTSELLQLGEFQWENPKELHFKERKLDPITNISEFVFNFIVTSHNASAVHIGS